MGSYSGSASTVENVIEKREEENSGYNEEYDGRGWGPRPDAGSVVRRSKRQVSVRVYHRFYELTTEIQPPEVTVSSIPSSISLRRALHDSRFIAAPSFS